MAFTTTNIYTRGETVSVASGRLSGYCNTLDIRLDDCNVVTIFDVPIARAREIAIELLKSCDKCDGGFSGIASEQAIAQQMKEQPEPCHGHDDQLLASN